MPTMPKADRRSAEVRLMRAAAGDHDAARRYVGLANACPERRDEWRGRALESIRSRNANRRALSFAC